MNVEHGLYNVGYFVRRHENDKPAFSNCPHRVVFCENLWFFLPEISVLVYLWTEGRDGGKTPFQKCLDMRRRGLSLIFRRSQIAMPFVFGTSELHVPPDTRAVQWLDKLDWSVLWQNGRYNRAIKKPLYCGVLFK